MHGKSLRPRDFSSPVFCSESLIIVNWRSLPKGPCKKSKKKWFFWGDFWSKKSPATCQVHFFFLYTLVWASFGRVCDQWSLPCLVFRYFSLFWSQWPLICYGTKFVKIVVLYILWLELAPRSLVPLATLKSKVLPIQLAQDTAGFQKCCL